MKLTINSQNLIDVQDCPKDDVAYVIVGKVEFSRHGQSFHNVTNNNMEYYEVKIPITDCIYLELEITSGVSVEDVCVTVRNKQGEEAKIQFTPKVRTK